MYQFGNSQANAQLTYYTGVLNQFQSFGGQMPSESQRVLQNVKIQTQYLMSQVSPLKQVMKNLAQQVKESLTAMTQQLVAIKKAAQSQRPKKKFKKVIMCPMEECGHKYSSKIALNCHIRNKHSSREQ